MVETIASLTKKYLSLDARVSKLEGKAPPAPVPPGPTPPSPGTPVPTASRYFSAKSNWNTPINNPPQLSANSPDYVKKLAALKPGTQEIQLNTGEWTVNVAIATGGFARGTARNPDGWRLDGIPFLDDAYGTSDSDGHLVVIDPAQQLAFNLWQARKTKDGWNVGAMGLFRLDGPGWWYPNGGGIPGPWTGRSSNASLLGGLIFPEELKAGVIPHALALGLDGSVLADKPVLPAYTTDAGGVVGGIPNGSRFQLDPALNLDTLGLGKEAKIIAKALQTYGAFVVERTSGLAMYFRSTQNGGANYAGMDFKGLNGNLLKQMRVIQPAASPEYDFPSRFSPPQPYRG